MKKLLGILVLGLLLSSNAYAKINWQKRNLCEKSEYKDLCSVILNKKLVGINTIANFQFDKGKIIGLIIVKKGDPTWLEEQKYFFKLIKNKRNLNLDYQVNNYKIISNLK